MGKADADGNQGVGKKGREELLIVLQKSAIHRGNEGKDGRGRSSTHEVSKK